MSIAPEPYPARYGRYALIAGASEGIGAAFARELAARGMDLVLLARRAQPLEALAAELRTGGRDVQVLPHDLADVEATRALPERLAELDVGMVVYNAAYSLVGPFLDGSLDDHLRELDVNCRSLLALVHGFGTRFAERGRGGIVVVTSMSSLQGSPRITNYAATKAYDLLLGEGLWAELGPRGVDVLAVLAGSTRTPGFERSKPRALGALAPPVMEPEGVVRDALAALGERPSIITGRANRIAGFLATRLLPRRTAILQMKKALDEMYG